MRRAISRREERVRPQWMKERRQREAEERAQKLKRELLMREIELGALNTKRYRTLWREMMMRIKMPQIVEDVEVAWRNFDRALDIKDYRISFLMDELAESEEQYQKNIRSHTETIDRLLGMYTERIQREEKNYRKTLNETLDQTDAEVSNIYHQQNEEEILLHLITNGVQRQLQESLNNAKSIAIGKIDAFVEESKDIRRLSAAQMENQLRSFWEDLRRVLSDYQNKTQDRQKHYEALKEKDEKDQKIIAQQLLRTTNLFEEIRKFQSKIATYNTSAKAEISEILNEHDFFQKAYWIVKNRFFSGAHYHLFFYIYKINRKNSVLKNETISEQTKDTDQLKTLSIEYNKTIKHLKDLATKGKRLLVLMQICSKYETQREKIILFAGQTKLENSSPPLSDQTIPDWDISRQVNFITYKSTRDRSIEFLRNI
ncbi:dynein regulatory complex subunit 2-like [Cataglyphis hispanica]|uniref:dynein regulatory complex subunit 2-like n=1 Tax=Cataglyphis hispanica TaxID=1086592 RepID=UPI00217F7359|nr:dynein regulatory complex subunit 2-like [Cataglyphis hispanica]